MPSPSADGPRQVVTADVLRHDCHLPRRSIRTAKAWTCSVCRRTWRLHPSGNAETRDHGSVVVSFTVQHLDGSEETFDVER